MCHTYINVGEYIATLTVVDNDGLSGIDSVLINVTLEDTVPPLVWVDHDPENPRSSDNVLFTASAMDSGDLDTISIYFNGAHKKTCDVLGTGAICAWSGSLPAGNHSYFAKANDTSGNVGQRDTENVVVSPSLPPSIPSVSITHDPENPTTADIITFTANATSTDGINQVSITVDGQIKKICDAGGASNYTCVYSTTLTSGSHNYYACANCIYDNNINIDVCTFPKIVTVTQSTAKKNPIGIKGVGKIRQLLLKRTLFKS
jgi:hypothetical protein